MNPKPLAFPGLDAALQVINEHGTPGNILTVYFGIDGQFSATMNRNVSRPGKPETTSAEAPTMLGALSLLDGELFAEQNPPPRLATHSLFCLCNLCKAKPAPAAGKYVFRTTEIGAGVGALGLAGNLRELTPATL